MGRVDVVIVSFDTREMTASCVRALLGEPLVERIIVVDNASTDGTAGALRAEFGDQLDVVVLEEPHGYAAANNRGAARGSAEHVLYLNSDILVTPGAVRAVVDALDADPGASCAGGRLVDPDTLETQSAYRPRPFPRLANFAVILSGVEERWPGNPVTRRYHGATVDAMRTTAVTAQPAAAALLVRRTDNEAIRGFDERFWFWFEDADIVRRLIDRGRVLYVPEAVFRHVGGGTFAAWSKVQQIRSIHHGILHYGAAHFTRGRRAALGALAVAISLPRILLFGRSRPEEAAAWRAVAAAGCALVTGARVPAIAPGRAPSR